MHDDFVADGVDTAVREPEAGLRGVQDAIGLMVRQTPGLARAVANANETIKNSPEAERAIAAAQTFVRHSFAEIKIINRTKLMGRFPSRRPSRRHIRRERRSRVTRRARAPGRLARSSDDPPPPDDLPDVVDRRPLSGVLYPGGGR